MPTPSTPQPGSPDGFGSAPGSPTIIDPVTGIAYVLAMDDSTNPPSVIYQARGSWARAKALFT